MSDAGKMISDALSGAVAAFDEAVVTIKENDNVVSDALLDSMQESFNRVAALARTLERVV